MRGLIDIHCHILPGLDDGARDMDEAIAMAKAAWEAGISEIIATPHFEEYVFENYRETILEATEEFRKELKKQDIPIKIYPGCEIMITPSVPELLKAGKLMTMKDEENYVLVELPLSMWPMYVEDVLYEIKLMGITPIIAHPERYREINEDVIVENIVQFNLGSLAGYYGSRSLDRLKKIEKIKEGKGIIYGTDMHSLEKLKYSKLKLELMVKQWLNNG